MTFSQSDVLALAFSALLLLLLQGSSCDRPGSGQGSAAGVVARIDDEVVTVDEFKDALERGAQKHPRIYTGPGRNERFLRYLVNEEVVFAQALAEGYDKDPQILREMRQRLVGEYLKRNLTPALDAVTVSDEGVARYYEQNIDMYRTHELMRAAVISVRVPPGTDESGRGALFEKASAVLEEARELSSDVPGFGELARRFSDDSKTKAAGGDIGWIVRKPESSRLDPTFRAAILKLEEPGDLTPVIKTEKAFYIGKLMELKAPQLQPFSRVRSAVKLLLLNKARDAVQKEFYRRLRAGRKIAVHLDILEEEEPAGPPKKRDVEAGAGAGDLSPDTNRLEVEKPGASE